ILESGRAVALIDSPNPLSLNLEGRVADVMRGIDWLEEVADGGLLDFDRLGITGHSMGGSESFALSRLDRRVRTAVSMAPGWPPNPARGLGQRTNTVIENALSMDGPEVRIIGARHDRVVKADDYARYLSDRCTNCEYVEMNHAGHNNFADMPVPGVPGLIRGRSGDRLGRVDVTALSSRVATGQRQRLEAANLVTQWFDQVLGVSPYSAH
ncbi:MAG: hypothetical protein KC416_16685, partial [Myxococcales bacterium]|nr:hypothetical protein [Myxococcales bacterium]